MWEIPQKCLYYSVGPRCLLCVLLAAALWMASANRALGQETQKANEIEVEFVMDEMVIEEFKDLARTGRLVARLEEQASMNTRTGTIGGHVFWSNIAECNGWRIQVNKLFGNWRILGPDNKRYAFGTKEFISKRIMGLSINKLTEIGTGIRDSVKGTKSTPSQNEFEKVRQEFISLVDNGKIIERLREQASTNIEGPTMGGKFCWDNLIEHKEWRLQQNEFFNNCRVLGPDDTRYAWGSLAYVSRRILGHPINFITNYIYVGGSSEKRFFKYSCDLPEKKGSVVLLHGWGCRAIVMEWLAKGLANLGYDAYCYDYPTSKMGIEDFSRRFLKDLEYLKGTLSKDQPLYLLTHSMGGLVVRKALELDTQNKVSSSIEQIVLLGPPNQGSLMADLAEGVGLGTVNHSIGDMKYLQDSLVKNIGKPAHYRKPFGIIGGRYDMKVLPHSSIEIPDMEKGKDYQIIKVDVAHPGLRNSIEVLLQTVYFFKNGNFK